MTSDLVTRLLAEIARAERTAQDARGAPWQAVKNALMDSRPSVAVRAPAVGFLNENDPDTVLRRCAAHRRMVESYRVTVKIRDEITGRRLPAQDLPPEDLDTWDRAQREASVMEEGIRCLAVGYGLIDLADVDG